MHKFHLRLISFLKKQLFVIFTVSFVLSGCAYSPPAPVKVAHSEKRVDFLTEVKPILDKRCVTCHSCYNSPCQAKFSSFDGIDRGGSKEKIYLVERLFPQKPTRLLIDAKTTQEWRNREFFSLTQNSAEAGYNNSIMGHMLYDKKENPEVTEEYAPGYDELTCAKSLEELSEFQEKHPNRGMPYGFPALEEKEYALIMQWLVQGAQGPSRAEQKRLEEPSASAQAEIEKWEKFLNTEDAKHRLSARYLYEHYFLAHLSFKRALTEFYTLVRSSTPPGEKPNDIGTLRPYDNPGIEKFYYRFEKIYSTIVHKTHIVLELDDAELERIKELFIDAPWLEKPHTVGYESELSANPFLVYAQIPPASRYRFLLGNSEYIIRTFIRGPSCRGQIALNVIHDHFWVMFQDPKYDIGVIEPEFLIQQAQNLRMPIETGSDEKIYRVFSDEYRNRYERYYDAKMLKLMQTVPQGWPIEGIWRGKRAGDAPLLTIYRHFDNASVHKGAIGELPQTMWVIDYAQFERIYYTLVAGFDVFGNISHQANVRRYMDFLRLEGEINFMLYMPYAKRREMLSSWYRGDGIAEDIQNHKGDSSDIGNRIVYQTERPMQEFIETIVDGHLLKGTGIHFDKVNYFRMEETAPSLPYTYAKQADFEQACRSIASVGRGFISHIVDQGVNVALIRVRLKSGEDLIETLIVNRWHENVNSLFDEKSRLDPSRDTLDIVQGTISSYPNLFFDVNEEDLPDFFDMLKNFEKSEPYIEKFKKYAISRSDKEFWSCFDWFQKRFYEDDTLNSGLYDLNSYCKKPW